MVDHVGGPGKGKPRRLDLRVGACPAHAPPGAVKDQQRPPLDHHDNCTFAVSVDWDAAQITLEGPSAGPGGGASLIPVPGVELVFDRAEGHLSQVVVEAGEPFGPVVPGEPVLAYLGRLLG